MSEHSAPLPVDEPGIATVPLPDGVHVDVAHGVPVIEIDVPTARATIHLDGAHVTSWIPRGGAEVLWVSPDALFGEGEAIRGGIPLIGPWFGPGKDGATSPKHGWLRTSRWELEAAERIGDAAAIVLRLDGADPSGHGITARAFVSVGEHLTVELTVTAGDVPLDLEAALHTYLAVSDVRTVALDGFDGAAYLDNLDGLARRRQDGPLALTEATDRIYDVDDEVAVRDPGAERTLREEPAGSTRTVVWNPWAQGASGMDDMPDDAWPGFVCVETAACKDGSIALEARRSHALRVRLVVDPA